MYERIRLSPAAIATALVLVLMTATPVRAQSIDDAADSLDTAISDLQDSRDDLEGYVGAADDDLEGATQAVREARHTMRSTAVSLLISSLDGAPKGEASRTMAALKVLEPTLFDGSGPAAKAPQRAGVASTDEIKRELIRESIASYPGSCPCPYNAARNGSSCGRRSAYSRPGGYAPLCYPKDITDEMVDSYRRSHKQ